MFVRWPTKSILAIGLSVLAVGCGQVDQVSTQGANSEPPGSSVDRLPKPVVQPEGSASGTAANAFLLASDAGLQPVDMRSAMLPAGSDSTAGTASIGYEVLYRSADASRGVRLAVYSIGSEADVTSLIPTLRNVPAESLQASDKVYRTPASTTEEAFAAWVDNATLITLRGSDAMVSLGLDHIEAVRSIDVASSFEDLQLRQSKEPVLASVEFREAQVSMHASLDGSSTSMCVQESAGPSCAVPDLGPFGLISIGDQVYVAGYEDLKGDPVAIRTEPELKFEAIEAGDQRWQFAEVGTEILDGGLTIYATFPQSVTAMSATLSNHAAEFADSLKEFA